MTPFQIGGCHVYISGEQCREWRKSCLPPFFSDHPCQGGWACAHPLCQVDIVYFLKHCQRHNGPRLLSLKLELSLQLKSFNTFSLPSFLRDRLPTILTTITSPMAQQPILLPTWTQMRAPIFHATPAPLSQLRCKLVDLPANIGYLLVNFLLHHHLNCDHRLQIALFASSASIELVSSSARVTSVKFQKGLGVT